MIWAGRFLLVTALAGSLYTMAAYLYAARSGSPEWAKAARRVLYVVTAVVTVTVAVLEAAFLRSDFSFALVADHSSTSTPTFYKLTAMWSSQAGSLLLWLWILVLMVSVVMFLNRRRRWDVLPWAGSVLMGVASFFTLLLVFYTSPFVQLSPVPIEGAGLNPLLHHPSMMMHPPALYTGYVGFVIPFAFAIGALITRNLGAAWVRTVRKFALVAWIALGIGILIGARWSYAELGWGGYWAWDPVENASLMPWLTGTAFLHTSIVQERRGILKIWNMGLVITTFVLSLIGTFLVRSGVLDSIHAFGGTTVGVPLVAFIAVVLMGSVVLLATRWEDLRSERVIESPLSREAAFLLNNLLLVGLCFVVFWGTFFPLISEAVTGTRASVGAPWFGQYVTPLAIALVGLAGVGPLIAWRGTSWTSLLRSLAIPVAVGVLTLVTVVVFIKSGRDPAALAVFFLGAFAIAAVISEFVKGTMARRSVSREWWLMALAALVRRNRRRYGGYIVHLGVVVMLIGVAASLTFQSSRDARLRPGQRVTVGDYEWHYIRPTTTLDNEKISFGAEIEALHDGKRISLLNPSRSYFPSRDSGLGSVGRFFRGESTSEVGLKAGFANDLWTAVRPDLRHLEDPIREADRRFPDADAATLSLILPALGSRYLRKPGLATFRLNVNPMVSWIWTGGIVVVLGGLVALWPAGRTVRGRLREGVSLATADGASPDSRRAELLAARESLYLQIRDAEMDSLSGKLSKSDFESLNQSLRLEAIRVLRELEGLESEEGSTGDKRAADGSPSASESARH